MAACRLVVLEFGLGLEFGLMSIFAAVGLGLGKFFVTKSTFNFHLFCLGRMTSGQRMSYTQPKNLRY